MASPTIADFLDMALLVGTVVRCEVNTGARDPALCLWIDFGDGGMKQSSAKITDHYDPQTILGRQVVAVTGFEPIWVAGFCSEVLVVGALTDDGVVLLSPDRPVPPGSSVA